MEQLLIHVSEFRGRRYPNIPLPDDIDKADLGENPFFVTLPIGEVNAKSANGRKYPRSAVESLVRCINESRNLGHWGHPSLAERTQRSPAIRWLAAVIDDDGIAWGKCHAISEDAIRFLRSAKATNSKIGTSIWGDATMDADRVTVREVKLGYVDLLAEGEWGGVAATAAVPVLTSETKNQQETDMSDTTLTLTQRIEELTTQRDQAMGEKSALEQERDTLKAQLAEAQPKVAELEQLRPDAQHAAQIRQLISEEAGMYARLEINVSGYGNDLTSVLRDTIAKLKALEASGLAIKLDTAVESVPLEKLRPVVRRMIGPECYTDEQIKARIEEILAFPDIKALAETLVIQEAGPNAHSGAKPQPEAEKKAKEIVESAQERAASMGIARQPKRK